MEPTQGEKLKLTCECCKCTKIQRRVTKDAARHSFKMRWNGRALLGKRVLRGRERVRKREREIEVDREHMCVHASVW